MGGTRLCEDLNWASEHLHLTVAVEYVLNVFE